MKHTPPKSVWVWHGILPLRLTGQDLALALLLREQPFTAQQLCAVMRKSEYCRRFKSLRQNAKQA